MISNEKAIELKELGFICAGYPVCSSGDYAPRCETERGCDEPYYYLCQLLEEIEERGYTWELFHKPAHLRTWTKSGGYIFFLFNEDFIWWNFPRDEYHPDHPRYSDTPEDAVASALKYLLKEERLKKNEDS